MAVRIPEPVVEAVKLKEGAALDMETSVDGTIRLPPLEPTLKLEDLVASMNDGNLHGEKDWTKPQGNETW